MYRPAGCTNPPAGPHIYYGCPRSRPCTIHRHRVCRYLLCIQYVPCCFPPVPVYLRFGHSRFVHNDCPQHGQIRGHTSGQPSGFAWFILMLLYDGVVFMIFGELCYMGFCAQNIAEDWREWGIFASRCTQMLHSKFRHILAVIFSHIQRVYVVVQIICTLWGIPAQPSSILPFHALPA